MTELELEIRHNLRFFGSFLKYMPIESKSESLQKLERLINTDFEGGVKFHLANPICVAALRLTKAIIDKVAAEAQQSNLH